MRPTKTNHYFIPAAALAMFGFACSDETETLPGPLIEIRTATAAECPSGGRTIVAGVDRNRDGTLADDEIESTRPVCAGEPGEPGEDGVPGTNALIRTSEETAGDNCADGGIRIEVGLDANDNDTLDPDEVQQTSFVCDGPVGQPGLETLVRTSPVAGEPCTESGSGLRIEWGLDQNRNDVLEDTEVEEEQVLCDGDVGLTTLVVVLDEPAGANCSNGGSRIESGVDLNGDGILDPVEVEDTEFVCDVISTRVRVSAELAGTSTVCENGGSRIETGPDLNRNARLDDTEVTDTTFVCSGDAGQQTLVSVTDEPAGANCVNGGQRVETGVDTNEDGTLQATEITATSFVCNGERGADGSGGNAVRVSAEPPGSDCANGGTRIETGPDTNNNGALDGSEVTNTTFACQGSATTSLVTTTDEPAGSNCAGGGVRIDSGIDDDGDGVLATAEIDTTQYVCDTTNTNVPFAITTQSVTPDGFEGDIYSTEITAAGGTGGNYAWSISAGSLPPGLSLDASGTPTTEISGTLTTVGNYTFTVEVSDFFNQTAQREFTIEVLAPPCEPGVDGLAGTARTDITVPSSFGSGIRSIAADTSTSGWVYHVDPGDDLERFAKDGSATEDVLALVSGLSAGDLNTVMIDGDDIYISSDDASCVSRCIQRISDDGGATFSLQDIADFSTTAGGDTNDDIRGMAVDGDTLYAITHDSTETELWSVDLTAPLPAAPTLEATFSDLEYCSGMALDDSYFYWVCDQTDGSGNEGLVRVDRTTFSVGIEEMDLDLGVSGFGEVEAQDPDGDGVADVAWVQGDANGGGQSFYACAPQDPLPLFVREWGTAADDDEGLAYDSSLNALWQIEESSTTAYRFD
jgi:hypothetical protein